MGSAIASYQEGSSVIDLMWRMREIAKHREHPIDFHGFLPAASGRMRDTVRLQHKSLSFHYRKDVQISEEQATMPKGDMLHM